MRPTVDPAPWCKVKPDTPACYPCDWWDLWVGCEHGDPYVFPDGVAQPDHPFLTLGREEDDQLAIT